jgi:hypothetical protein
MDINTILSICSYQVESTDEGLAKDFQDRINRIQRFQTERPVMYISCLKQAFSFLQEISRRPKARKILFNPEAVEGMDLEEISFFVWDFFTVLQRLKIVSYSGVVAKDWMGTQVLYIK